jgi:serine/threonine-protein kinase
MYELLTGTKPFVGDNISNLILQILQKDPDPPSKIAAKVPPLLDHIVMKALEKDSMKRYQSANEIASALREFVSSFSTSKTGY